MMEGEADRFVTVVAVEAAEEFVTVLNVGGEQPTDGEDVLVYRLPGERLGFGLKFEGGTGTGEHVKRLFIQSCAPDSPASRATCSWGSLQEGDEVLQIDSVPVNMMTRLDCVRCLKDSHVVLKLQVRHAPPPPVPPRRSKEPRPPEPEVYLDLLAQEAAACLTESESDDTGSSISTVVIDIAKVLSPFEQLERELEDEGAPTLQPPINFQDAPLSYGDEKVLPPKPAPRKETFKSGKKRPPPPPPPRSDRPQCPLNVQTITVSDSDLGDLPRLVDVVPKSECDEARPSFMEGRESRPLMTDGEILMSLEMDSQSSYLMDALQTCTYDNKPSVVEGSQSVSSTVEKSQILYTENEQKENRPEVVDGKESNSSNKANTVNKPVVVDSKVKSAIVEQDERYSPSVDDEEDKPISVTDDKDGSVWEEIELTSSNSVADEIESTIISIKEESLHVERLKLLNSLPEPKMRNSILINTSPCTVPVLNNKETTTTIKSHEKTIVTEIENTSILKCETKPKIVESKEKVKDNVGGAICFKENSIESKEKIVGRTENITESKEKIFVRKESKSGITDTEETATVNAEKIVENEEKISERREEMLTNKEHITENEVRENVEKIANTIDSDREKSNMNTERKETRSIALSRSSPGRSRSEVTESKIPLKKENKEVTQNDINGKTPSKNENTTKQTKEARQNEMILNTPSRNGSNEGSQETTQNEINNKTSVKNESPTKENKESPIESKIPVMKGNKQSRPQVAERSTKPVVIENGGNSPILKEGVKPPTVVTRSKFSNPTDAVEEYNKSQEIKVKENEFSPLVNGEARHLSSESNEIKSHIPVRGRIESKNKHIVTESKESRSNIPVNTENRLSNSEIKLDKSDVSQSKQISHVVDECRTDSKENRLCIAETKQKPEIIECKENKPIFVVNKENISGIENEVSTHQSNELEKSTPVKSERKELPVVNERRPIIVGCISSKQLLVEENQSKQEPLEREPNGLLSSGSEEDDDVFTEITETESPITSGNKEVKIAEIENRHNRRELTEKNSPIKESVEHTINACAESVGKVIEEKKLEGVEKDAIVDSVEKEVGLSNGLPMLLSDLQNEEESVDTDSDEDFVLELPEWGGGSVFQPGMGFRCWGLATIGEDEEDSDNNNNSTVPGLSVVSEEDEEDSLSGGQSGKEETCGPAPESQLVTTTAMEDSQLRRLPPDGHEFPPSYTEHAPPPPESVEKTVVEIEKPVIELEKPIREIEKTVPVIEVKKPVIEVKRSVIEVDKLITELVDKPIVEVEKSPPPLPVTEPPPPPPPLKPPVRVPGWRKDEKSECSVRDKIAMFSSAADAQASNLDRSTSSLGIFSPEKTSNLDRAPSTNSIFLSHEKTSPSIFSTSEKLDRPPSIFSAIEKTSTLSRGPSSLGIFTNSERCSSVDHAPSSLGIFSSSSNKSSNMERTHSSLNVYPSNEAKSNNMDRTRSSLDLSYSPGSYCNTLPRKPSLPKTTENGPRLTRATSFSGGSLHARSQSLIDIGKGSVDDVRKASLNALIEQRRRGISKLRGLVIPEKVTEVTAPSPSICDLPEIKSRDSILAKTTAPTPMQRPNSMSSGGRWSTGPCSINTNSSATKPVPPIVIPSPPWKTSNSANLPKYSPAFKRKSLTVYSISATTNNSIRDEPPPSLESITSPARSDLSFEYKSPASEKSLSSGRHHLTEDESDTDSAVSSSRSSISPPSTPPPPSSLSPLRRTLSSETTASASSSTASTITCGSSDSNRRVLKAQSVEAINRKNVLSSARYSSGRDLKVGSPLIQRKFDEEERRVAYVTDVVDMVEEEKQTTPKPLPAPRRTPQPAPPKPVQRKSVEVNPEEETDLLSVLTGNKMRRQRSRDDVLSDDRRSASVHDIRKTFEMAGRKANHARVSSLDSTASEDSFAPPQYGSVGNLHREQFGSVTSIASSTSLISPQELQLLIDEANQPTDDCDVVVVVLHRECGTTGSIGITLAGGADYEAKEITVHKVLAGSPADRDGRIQKGDRILSINGRSMKGVTHRESLNILKAPRPEVVLVVSRSRGLQEPQHEEESPISTHVSRSSRPPRIPEQPVEVTSVPTPAGDDRGPPVIITLTKDGAGLGFSLEGGKDSPLGDKPLTIKKIFTGGSAEKNGQLCAGDELLNVNGTDVTVMSRIEAWGLMKRLSDGPVALTVRHRLIK